ncbi:MAG: bifunctional glutamate--cysteine ligase GshA/glutathione synthetase GshB [Atopostipes sp.]|nr:bifunctional glutamate--cysteine ligase GshA/glutathione synthetase GshB [Atopostipes sp.]
MNLSSIIQNNHLEALFYEGNYGIEKEGLRTNAKDKLAQTDHPKSLGSRLYHPYLHTDFSESQPEIVTPAMPSIKEALNWLEALHDVFHRSMKSNEYLWPYSMPNILPEEDEIPIIRYKDSDAIQYREELAERYGKKLQTISGIHLNFSFSDSFISESFKYQHEYKNIKDYKNNLYMKLVANFLKYEWILLYLFGASPYADESFYDSKAAEGLKVPEDYIRSIRNSSFGYHNHEKVKVSYESIESYIRDIEYFVEKDYLSVDREFYGNARLRGIGDRFKDMLETGVEYIEFRSVDLNPLDRLGLSEDQLEFYHLFFMCMVWMDQKATGEEIRKGEEINLEIAHEDPFEKTVYYKDALNFLQILTDMVKDLNLEKEYLDLVKKAKGKFEKPEQSLSARIAKIIDDKGYLNHARELGLKYKDYSVSRPYLLNGFDDMELSTQMLISDALRLGVKTKILDRSDQFLRLAFKGNVEYVRNGNMTSKDTTISHFLMGNKTVTKKVLAKDGYSVPEGEVYHSVGKGLDSYGKFKDKSIVVKPKSTNYGIGISVFQDAPSKESFDQAIKLAFEEDETVLVEEFISGTEYRFFVLDDKVEAILLRIPANVVGDGQSTIEELIDQKNENPLRGEEHKTPMGLIQKGKLEELMLKEQGYDFHSIPDKDCQVYLRENSNISTGGDSIDFTDEMHESYHKVAEGIAKSLDVKVTGIDLIIPNYKKESTKRDPGYSCIEANFNPAMSMHAYVTEGKGRFLTPKILTMLYPSLKEY